MYNGAQRGMDACAGTVGSSANRIQASRDESEIGRELARLRETVRMVSNAAGELASRLLPVSRSAPIPMTSSNDAPESTVETPLGEELRSLRYTVDGILATLNDAHSRLAI